MEVFILKGGQQQGPFLESRIRDGIDGGEFSPGDMAWTAGKASWQPLSSLIGLDVTKPPPIEGIEIPEVAEKPPALPTISPTNSAVPNVVPDVVITKPEAQSGGRTCKQCGAPYKLWSPTRAMASGLCVNCSPKQEESTVMAITPIVSRNHALKAVRNAGILYLILGAVNFLVGAMDDPFQFVTAVILWVGGLTVWFAHSRIAAVGLLIVMGLGSLYTVLDEGPQGLLKGGPLLLLIQLAVTINATNAVFKLNNQYEEEQEEPQVRPI